MTIISSKAGLDLEDINYNKRSYGANNAYKYDIITKIVLFNFDNRQSKQCNRMMSWYLAEELRYIFTLILKELLLNNLSENKGQDRDC
jgi:hypothetical protein